jgi:hypothetical protein
LQTQKNQKPKKKYYLLDEYRSSKLLKQLHNNNNNDRLNQLTSLTKPIDHLTLILILPSLTSPSLQPGTHPPIKLTSLTLHLLTTFHPTTHQPNLNNSNSSQQQQQQQQLIPNLTTHSTTH